MGDNLPPHRAAEDPHRFAPYPQAYIERVDAKRRRPDAKCPLRPGDPCTLCQVNVTGPQDCGLVYLIMDDPEARDAWAENRRAQREAQAVS